MSKMIECPACLNGQVNLIPSSWTIEKDTRDLYILLPEDPERSGFAPCPLCHKTAKVPAEHAAAFRLVLPNYPCFLSYQWLKELCQKLNT